MTFSSPLLSAPGSRFFVEPCAMATHLNKRIQQTVVSPSTCQIIWPVTKSTGLAARTMPPASNCTANLAVGHLPSNWVMRRLLDYRTCPLHLTCHAALLPRSMWCQVSTIIYNLHHQNLLGNYAIRPVHPSKNPQLN